MVLSLIVVGLGLRPATMPSAYGDAMKRRSKAGGELTKGRRRTASKLERRNAPKAVRRSNSYSIGEEAEVARLARELREALEQQTATSEILRLAIRSQYSKPY